MFSAKNKIFMDLQTLSKCIRLYGGQNISKEKFSLIQVFAIESVPFEIESVAFAIELVPFAIEFVGFAIEFIPFAIEFSGFAIKFITFTLKFVHNKNGSWKKHENMV